MATAAPDPNRWKALALICTAIFVVVLDVAIVNVALPSIERDLGFAPENLQWVITAYALTFGGFLLLGGRAADLLGRRLVFMVGLALFTVASLVCGLSQSDEMLIAARAVQGLGAAIVSPAALSIISVTFTEGSERNKALGAWGAVGGSGAAAGVLLGGILTKYLGWEWIFFVNIPVGIVVLALTTRFVRESRHEDAVHEYDVVGALSVTSGLVLLVYAISEAPDVGWAAFRTIGLLVLSGALLALLRLVGVADARTADAARDLPQPDAHRGERRQRPPVRRPLRLVLAADALHAASARPLRSADRSRVPGHCRNSGGAGRTCTGARHAIRSEARDPHRDLLSHVRRALVHADRRRRELPGRPLARIPRGRHRHSLLVHPAHDRGAGGSGRSRIRARRGPAEHSSAGRGRDRSGRDLDGRVHALRHAHRRRQHSAGRAHRGLPVGLLGDGRNLGSGFARRSDPHPADGRARSTRRARRRPGSR